MSRSVSSTFREAVSQPETKEVAGVLIKFDSDDWDVPLRVSTDNKQIICTNLATDPDFSLTVAEGEGEYWEDVNWDQGTALFGAYGEGGEDGCRLVIENGTPFYNSIITPFYVTAQYGEVIDFNVRSYLSSDYADSLNQGLYFQVIFYNSAYAQLGDSYLYTGVGTKGSWFDFEGSIDLDVAGTAFIRILIGVGHNSGSGAAGYAQIDNVYFGRGDEQLAGTTYRGTQSNSEEFFYAPVEVVLPEDVEGSMITSTLSIENVSRELMNLIRDLEESPSADISVVLASTPNTVEASFTGLKFSSITANAFVISGNIGLHNFLAEPYPGVTMRPGNFPGMF